MRPLNSRENLQRVLWEYGVDSRLLLALISLCSCSDVCVNDGVVRLQPFTVGFELGQVQACNQVSRWGWKIHVRGE